MLQRYKITAIYTSKQLAIRMLNKYKNLPTTHDCKSTSTDLPFAKQVIGCCFRKKEFLLDGDIVFLFHASKIGNCFGIDCNV